METIGKRSLESFLGRSQKAERVTCLQVREDPGHRVSSFVELAKKVAELQFRNSEHVLLFRGQARDYLSPKGNTTLIPSLFRKPGGQTLDPEVLHRRFDALEAAESSLLAAYGRWGFLGKTRVLRQRLLRWTILQHYEVCPTPLLDVTQSLRVAASFASQGDGRDAYVFVLGVPNLSGSITASAEAGLQIVRLSGACPPAAVRPHLQEGYLLGEYPEMTGFRQKQLYDGWEIDFGRRLLAKFVFDKRSFWKKDAFSRVPEKSLYPSPQQDPICELATELKSTIGV